MKTLTITTRLSRTVTYNAREILSRPRNRISHSGPVRWREREALTLNKSLRFDLFSDELKLGAHVRR